MCLIPKLTFCFCLRVREPLQAARSDAAALQCTYIEARAVTIKPLTDDLATTDFNATMAVVQREIEGLVMQRVEYSILMFSLFDLYVKRS